MYNVIMAFHVATCALMILVVLMQAGRGAGLSVFGGGGGDALFQTPSGTSFMRQLTGWLAVTFGITSLLLTLIGGRSGMSSVTNSFPSAVPPVQQAPVTPGAKPEDKAKPEAQEVPAAAKAAPAKKK